MCIRDSIKNFQLCDRLRQLLIAYLSRIQIDPTGSGPHPRPCLLYTSDAADERSSVDLGGRRIIKKKKNKELGACTLDNVVKPRQ